MFRNYLKIALRTLLRNKGYSFINIAGLTIGLTCCLLIFQYVAFEYSFDRFHDNESDLYRVVMSLTRGEESLGAGGTFTPQALGPALDEEIPELHRYSRLHPDYGAAVIVNPEQPDRVFEEEELFYVDRAFLEMFTFPLVAGSRESALEPGTVLISESMAEKYFGSQSPVGQVLEITGLVDDMYRVTGVFQDVPPNSHLQFDFLLPVEDLLETPQYVDEPEDGWSQNNFLTYVQLHPDADVALVSEKLTELFEARQGERLRDYGFTDSRMYVQPLRDVYLNDEVESVSGHIAGSSYRTVYFFTIIGLVTLLIALVNYVNLATARALDRAREVGVRKAIGAERGQLIRQFLLESALTNGVAAVLAVGLAVLLTPIVNNLTGTELTLALWMNPLFWLAFLAIFGIATLLAGLYPAFVLSSFKPVTVLKGKGASLGGQLWLRRGLVVFQFAAAVVLIGGTAIVYNQLQYMRTMDLGMDLEQVVTIQQPRSLPDGTDQASANNTFIEELRRFPAVGQVAISGAHPGQNFNWQGASTWRAEEDQATAINGVVTYIDTSFVSLYGLEVVAGSNFDETSAFFGAESPYPVLANETAIRALGFGSPQEAIDHLLLIGGYEVRVVGVLKDFNWSSAHVERQRMFFGRTSGVGTISARVSTENLSQTIASIEQTYTELFPGNPFGYGFADEQFERLYQSDQRFASIFAGFAGLAIFIACLGLFGLAAFTAQQRTKEIGVRKVLGATAPQIVSLLSKDFAQLVAIAFVIAAPIAYFIMRSWLQDFAYRIELGPGVFAVAGLIALAIALLAVSYHAVKAAYTDPATSLRYE